MVDNGTVHGVERFAERPVLADDLGNDILGAHRLRCRFGPEPGEIVGNGVSLLAELVEGFGDLRHEPGRHERQPGRSVGELLLQPGQPLPKSDGRIGLRRLGSTLLDEPGDPLREFRHPSAVAEGFVEPRLDRVEQDRLGYPTRRAGLAGALHEARRAPKARLTLAGEPAPALPVGVHPLPALLASDEPG